MFNTVDKSNRDKSPLSLAQTSVAYQSEFRDKSPFSSVAQGSRESKRLVPDVSAPKLERSNKDLDYVYPGNV